MRDKRKIKLIIITLGIVIILMPILINIIGYRFNAEIKNKNLERDNTSNLKSAGFWVLTPISIDSDSQWSTTNKTQPWCNGNGTWNDPYIIENVTIDGQSSGSCIEIKNSNVYFIIRNCTIYNSGSGSYEAGIRLENTNNGRLIGNNCSNNGGYGISLYNNCDNNNITGNTANYNDDGIFIVEYCDDNNISGNTFNNNENAGMYIEVYCGNNIISGNSFNNNGDDGMHINANCNLNNISGNNINNNGDDGIYLEIGDNTIISGNNINNNGDDGIYLEIGDNTIISGNNINNNGGKGIFLNYNSDCNLIYNNSFIDNNNNAYDRCSDNEWDNGAIGNYWSDYPGKDANDDGFGDTPYNISGDAGSQDNYTIWWDPVAFSITTSNPNDAFSHTAPDFTITINEGITNTLWYTIDGGLTNISCSTSNNINQTTWDDLDDDDFTLTCFANDSRGYLTMNSITIQKDTVAPIITLNSPTPNQIYKEEPPDFIVSIIEENLFSTWYTIVSIAENFMFTGLTGTINQTAWNNVPNGEVNITFYAQDRAGTIGSVRVVVIKRIPTGPPIPGYSLFFLLGIISLVSILISKKIKKHRNYNF